MLYYTILWDSRLSLWTWEGESGTLWFVETTWVLRGSNRTHSLFCYVCMFLVVFSLLFGEQRCTFLLSLSLSPGTLTPLSVRSVFIISNRKISNWGSRILKANYAAYLSVLSQISNCQGLGRKKRFEFLKTDRMRNNCWPRFRRGVRAARLATTGVRTFRLEMDQ